MDSFLKDFVRINYESIIAEIKTQKRANEAKILTAPKFHAEMRHYPQAQAGYEELFHFLEQYMGLVRVCLENELIGPIRDDATDLQG
ncbi:hypothetical protein RRF57_006226 [Xylaria bambusicola]|uniref:Uncharacterized protein n=1 Tax=Xylaria bambusicola TaxID=326684 RepID=A0AAN7UPW1_9PEZI